MSDSRLSGFYRLAVNDRIGVLERDGWLSAGDATLLRDGRHVLHVRPLGSVDVDRVHRPHSGWVVDVAGTSAHVGPQRSQAERSNTAADPSPAAPLIPTAP